MFHILAVRLKTDLWKALSLHFLIVKCITLGRSENELRDRIPQNNDHIGQAFALLAHSLLTGVTVWPSGLSNVYSWKQWRIDITFCPVSALKKKTTSKYSSVGNFRRVPGPPYFQFKLRPTGPRKFISEAGPLFYLRDWMRPPPLPPPQPPAQYYS